ADGRPISPSLNAARPAPANRERQEKARLRPPPPGNLPCGVPCATFITREHMVARLRIPTAVIVILIVLLVVAVGLARLRRSGRAPAGHASPAAAAIELVLSEQASI